MTTVLREKDIYGVEANPQIEYTKKLLKLVENDIREENSNLNSAKVNLRRLKEQQVELIIELRDMERMSMAAENPTLPKLTELSDKQWEERFETIKDIK